MRTTLFIFAFSSLLAGMGMTYETYTCYVVSYETGKYYIETNEDKEEACYLAMHYCMQDVKDRTSCYVKDVEKKG